MTLTRRWRTSQHSNPNGACVEVAQAGPVVLVRDSRDRTGPRLAVGQDTWTAFTNRVRRPAMTDREDDQQKTAKGRGLFACRRCGGLGLHYLTCPVLRLPEEPASAWGELS